MTDRIAILFDIDGTLIISGGAGAGSWRLAFDELYGIPADIGQYTDTGMTDPDVARRTFEGVLQRAPSRTEFAKLLERRLFYLHTAVARSQHYRVLDGATRAEITDNPYRVTLVQNGSSNEWYGLIGFLPNGPSQVAGKPTILRMEITDVQGNTASDERRVIPEGP